jgi:hypothetical protein
MIRSVTLGEEIVVTTKNKVGIMADIAMTLANEGVNIESVVGYEEGQDGKVMLVTSANIRVMDELKAKGYKDVKEREVILVDLENKRGALKVVTQELKDNEIDIQHLYVTSPTGPGTSSSKMVLLTNDNEAAMAVLTKYAEKGGD